MQDFFRSKKFIVILLLVAVSFFFMLRASYTGTAVPFVAKVTSFVTQPFQKAATKAYNAVYDSFSDFIHAPSISKENDKLKEENAKLLSQIAELDKYKNENKQMKEFLGVKEENSDFVMEPAEVIGRDASDRFYSFTIDKGEKQGIKKYAPCITSQGLVGMVTAVGPNYAKVSTILDSTVEVGVKVMETSDIGITEGNAVLATDGKLRLSYLPRDSKVQIGGLVHTTGIGGIFPEGILVGVISKVSPDSQGLTINAVISPLMDIKSVTEVMIIKDFSGKEDKED